MSATQRREKVYFFCHWASSTYILFNSSLSKEGWDDEESGWNEEDGWGGDAALPDLDKQEQEKVRLVRY